jgi:polyisoprenoid-binding protein YceI
MLACLASVARWLMQDSGNLYTDFGRDFYIPDPDLGWRLVSTTRLWLGVDAVLLLGLCCLAVAASAFVVGRIESKSGQKRKMLRRALVGLGTMTWLVPLWAFGTGLAPEGARDKLPAQRFALVEGSGLQGRLLAVSAGGYELLPHAGTQITASVKAGGETFEARFAGNPKGVLRFDPTDLSQPMTAEFTFASSSVDTGIELRDKHAREALHTDEFETIAFTLQRVLDTANTGPNALSFRAEGVLTLMDKTSVIPVAGTISAPDAESRKRLGFADEEILLVRASLAISVLQDSPLEDDGTFDQDTIEIQVSLLLRRRRVVGG